jgi:hypothetical protein
MRAIDRNEVHEPDGVRSVTGPDEDYPEDVIAALRYLYRNKCYLCENELEDKGRVDQFHPADTRHRKRASNWRNLHWACLRCRELKQREPYQIRDPANRQAPVTLLLNPSGRPFGHRVNELIRFTRELRAEGIGKFSLRRQVARTVEFLNGPPWHDRRTRYEELLYLENYVRTWADLWEDLLGKDLDPSIWPDEQRGVVFEALKSAKKVYWGYLEDSRPFATSVGQALEELTGVSVEQFKHLSDVFERDWEDLKRDSSAELKLRLTIKRWEEKREFYREEEAITADPPRKFELRQRIKEAEQKIEELKKKIGNPRKPPSKM